MDDYLGITGALDYGSHLYHGHGDTIAYINEPAPTPKKRTRKIRLDPSFLQVRSSICVVGFHSAAIQRVKQFMSSLVEEPLPFESFHVKKPSDIKDGALLVPKLVFVGMHCPGRKLIDSEGEEGQLDLLYDEACELGADILVVYMGLPRVIYKPIRHMVHHPRMSDTVFPYQPVLKELAAENCLITQVENCEFTNMQKNVMREWMLKPVGTSHPIYKAAEYLSATEYSLTDVEFWNEGELNAVKKGGFHTDGELQRAEYDDFVPATEEHPILDSKQSKKKKKKLKYKKRREANTWGKRTVDMMPVNEAYDDRDDDGNIELELYSKPTTYGSYGSYGSLDSFNASMDV